MQQHRRIIVVHDGYFVGSSGGSFLEGFNAAARAIAQGDDSREVGAKLHQPAPCDPHDQIKPVSTDVGNNAQLAAEFWFQAPIPIGREKQPILEEAPMYNLWLPDRATRDD